MSKQRAALAAVILIALLTAGCASQAGPTPVPLQNTDIPVTSSSPAPTQTTAPQPPATQTAPPAVTDPAPSAPAQAVEYVIVPDRSEARYRVTEQLVNRDLPSDAIGRTNQIGGSIVLDAGGQIDAEKSKITVNVASLATDQSRRDNFVRGNILQTDQYPEAYFVPREISGLSFPLPETGQVSFQVTGDLTIRDVTRPVTWAVSGAVEGGQAVGTASTTFTFAEFNLSQPRVPVVLSVKDSITLETDITLQRSQP